MFRPGWLSVCALLWLLIIRRFSKPRATTISLPLDWSPRLPLLYQCTLWWKLFSVNAHLSDKTGVYRIQWKHSNIWRTVQIADCLAVQQFYFPLFAFEWMLVSVLVWYFYSRLKETQVLWLKHTHVKNKNVFNVIFVTIEVYIFIQRFGLYGGPVTDCTFVGNVLS